MSTSRHDPLAIYMAGKIGRRDWRHDIVGWKLESAKPGEEINFGENLIYTGPHFIEYGGHGCGHGQTTHGCGGAAFSSHNGDQRDRLDVVNRCLSSIRNSDLVFVWLDSIDCYGTLAEIGYAHAFDIPIALAYERKFYSRIPAGLSLGKNNDIRHELWFIESIAKVFTVSSSAEKAFNSLISIIRNGKSGVLS